MVGTRYTDTQTKGSKHRGRHTVHRHTDQGRTHNGLALFCGLIATGILCKLSTFSPCALALLCCVVVAPTGMLAAGGESRPSIWRLIDPSGNPPGAHRPPAQCGTRIGKGHHTKQKKKKRGEKKEN